MSKRVIKLTEKDLKNIIKEAVASVVSEKNSHFDINNVPIEDLRRQYVDYRIKSRFPRFDSRLSEVPLDEDIDHSVPLEEVKEELIQKYGLADWQFSIFEGANKIYVAIFIADIKENLSIIEHEMAELGYFKSFDEPLEVDGMHWLKAQFEPMFQNKENNAVRDMRVVFHITPRYNLDSILVNGLIPRSRNTVYSYPDRIFLVKGTANEKDLYLIGRRLCITNNDERNDGRYCILTVDVSKIDNDVDFFFDPNLEVGLFTDSPIPPEAIISVREVNFGRR